MRLSSSSETPKDTLKGFCLGSRCVGLTLVPVEEIDGQRGNQDKNNASVLRRGDFRAQLGSPGDLVDQIFRFTREGAHLLAQNGRKCRAEVFPEAGDIRTYL